MNKTTAIKLLKFIKPHRQFLFIALICSLISAGFSLFIPVVIGQAVDHIVDINNVDFEMILHYIKVLAILILVGAVFSWLFTFSMNIVAEKTVKLLRTRCFEKINSLSIGYIDKKSHGDLIARVTVDIDQISTGILQGFSNLFNGIVTIVVTLIFMLTVNIPIALVVVILTPLSLFVASFIAKRTFNTFKLQSQIRGEITGYSQEIFTNLRLVKAYNCEEASKEKYQEINDRLYTSGVKSQFYSSITNPCTRFVNAIVYAAVGICGAIMCIYSPFSVGQLSAFLAYANQYTKPFNEITGVLAELQNAFAGAQRVFELLEEDKIESDKQLRPLKFEKGNIIFKQAAFAYDPKRPLIKKLNLIVKSGQRVAIVGPTGCGKTTLINLLMRFYDLNSGQIDIDGQDTRYTTRASLRTQFGTVLQESDLFTMSIKDNIAYGKPDADMDSVIAAAKNAHIHNFIMRLPDGYDTLISENSDNISQGQKQLLCIARTMLLDPPMLILDEATSNIDTRTEMQIQKAFTKMMEGRTSFIVAHRLSTIKEADIILVMNDGDIIEQGNHEDLIAKKGFYCELYNSQFAKQ